MNEVQTGVACVRPILYNTGVENKAIRRGRRLRHDEQCFSERIADTQRGYEG